MNENQLKDTTIGTTSLPLSQVLPSGYAGMLFGLMYEYRYEFAREYCHQTVRFPSCYCFYEWYRLFGIMIP